MPDSTRPSKRAGRASPKLRALEQPRTASNDIQNDDAKSRLLAAAIHDLRQPLQELTLLQGLLAKAVGSGGPAEALVTQLDETLAAMSAMLNTVLDTDQVAAPAHICAKLVAEAEPDRIEPRPAPAPSYEEPRTQGGSSAPAIFIVDDDFGIRSSICEVLEAEGRHVEAHASSESFLRSYRSGAGTCLLVDAHLPGIGGLDLLRRLRGMDDQIPTIVITGHGDVHMAVEAMRAGASDFIEKPVRREELLASLERALEESSSSGKLSSWRATAAKAFHDLTDRQRQVMALVIAGYPSKNIAADLGISQRTVENHRAAIMKRTNSKSLPALARLALAAAWTGSDASLVAAGPPADRL